MAMFQRRQGLLLSANGARQHCCSLRPRSTSCTVAAVPSPLKRYGAVHARAVATRARHRTTLDVFRISRSGTMRQESVSTDELLKGSLLARDIIGLGAGNASRLTSSQQAPSIMPRDDAIIVTLSHLKSVIYHDHVLLFNCHRSPAMVKHSAMLLANFLRQEWDITQGQEQESLSSGSSKSEPLAFELNVLEGLLRDICAKYSQRVLLVQPVVDRVLDELMGEHIAAEQLQHLLALNDGLATTELGVRDIIGCLDDLIKNDEDMLALLLTEHRELAINSSGGEQAVAHRRHDQVELLLESYHRKMSEVYQDIFYLRTRVTSTKELAQVLIVIYDRCSDL
jgi:hypothetical protein